MVESNYRNYERAIRTSLGDYLYGAQTINNGPPRLKAADLPVPSRQANNDAVEISPDFSTRGRSAVGNNSWQVSPIDINPYSSLKINDIKQLIFDIVFSNDNPSEIEKHRNQFLNIYRNYVNVDLFMLTDWPDLSRTAVLEYQKKRFTTFVGTTFLHMSSKATPLSQFLSGTNETKGNNPWISQIKEDPEELFPKEKVDNMPDYVWEAINSSTSESQIKGEEILKILINIAKEEKDINSYGLLTDNTPTYMLDSILSNSLPLMDQYINLSKAKDKDWFKFQKDLEFKQPQS